MITHVFRGGEKQLCHQSHYAAIVDAQKDVEVYQLGDVDCPDCLRRMAEKHEALAATFRARLTGDAPQALCHECSEMVDVLAGHLAAHHGKTGDGCPKNGAPVQIWLHPLVADRIALLEAELAFGSGREER
jgi:hypothetical protein